MFNKVLIGFDDHEGGRDAIALARQLVSADGELELAYVHGGYPIPARGSNAEFERAERDRAHGVLSRAAEESGIDRTVSLGAASVGRGLHEIAERDGADLLVVGSTRRGLRGRVMLGDDTNHALNGAPCAVAIAPAGYAEHANGLADIGVGYNASAESDRAIQVARALAAEKDASLSAFQAVVIPGYVFAAAPELTEAALDSCIEDAREAIAELGDIEPHVVYGDPVEELTEFSESVDLLIVGSRDYGPLGRLVHGSTSHALARTVHCPLLVLTRAAQATLVTDETDPEHASKTTGSPATAR